jgi:hypothetical protein
MTSRLPAALLVLLLAALQLPAQDAPAPILRDHQFTAAEQWADLPAFLARGWSFNIAGQVPGAVTVAPGPFTNVSGALLLQDISASDFLVATYAFTPLTAGTLTLTLGTLGTQDQRILLELVDAQGTTLAKLALRNNSLGSFQAAGGETAIKDSTPWLRAGRVHQLTWSAATATQAGTIAYSFVPLGAGLAPIATPAQPLLAPGQPAALRCKVGFAQGMDKGLLVDGLTLSGTP